MSGDVIRTKRLILRPWKDKDLDAFATMNADPRVMEYFPKLLTREESDELAKRVSSPLQENGWGIWAASLIDGADFIGVIGLAHVYFTAHFTPAVEVGWRLAYDFWNQGYATEGALGAIKYGFEQLKIDEIVAFTTVNNQRSRRVMEKIGMVHDLQGDFDHPKMPEGHPLQRHVLYRIKTGHFTEIWETPPSDFHAHVEVAACYVENEGMLLYMKRAPHCIEGKLWGIPAGKLEPKETPHQAARRELFEETGIDVLPSHIEEIGTLYVRKPRGMYSYHMFHMHLDRSPAVHLSAEHTEYIWAEPQAIESLPLVGGGKESLEFFKRMKKQL